MVQAFPDHPVSSPAHFEIHRSDFSLLWFYSMMAPVQLAQAAQIKFPCDLSSQLNSCPSKTTCVFTTKPKRPINFFRISSKPKFNRYLWAEKYDPHSAHILPQSGFASRAHTFFPPAGVKNRRPFSINQNYSSIYPTIIVSFFDLVNTYPANSFKCLSYYMYANNIFLRG